MIRAIEGKVEGKKDTGVDSRGRPMLSLVGEVFADWTVMEFAGVESGNSMWLCRCLCGVERRVRGGSLTNRDSRGCGCTAERGPGSPPSGISTTVSNGYLDARVWPDHPFYLYALEGKWSYRTGRLHRLVMAHELGRPLESYETVHHIDGNRRNNAIENLQLRQGNHGPGQVHRCRACGSHDIERVAL